MVGQATGGNPSSTGIYYDDTWNHDVFPPGTKNCAGPEVTYFEALDKNQGALACACDRLSPIYLSVLVLVSSIRQRDQTLTDQVHILPLISIFVRSQFRAFFTPGGHNLDYLLPLFLRQIGRQARKRRWDGSSARFFVTSARGRLSVVAE